MQALLALVMIPLMLLNAFGGVAAGLWLALLGEWWALGVGLIAICSPFLLSIILAPGLLLLAPAGILLDKQRPFLAFRYCFLVMRIHVW
jgi:hypothetical protein